MKEIMNIEIPSKKVHILDSLHHHRIMLRDMFVPWAYTDDKQVCGGSVQELVIMIITFLSFPDKEPISSRKNLIFLEDISFSQLAHLSIP